MSINNVDQDKESNDEQSQPGDCEKEKRHIDRKLDELCDLWPSLSTKCEPIVSSGHCSFVFVTHLGCKSLWERGAEILGAGTQ